MRIWHSAGGNLARILFVLLVIASTGALLPVSATRVAAANTSKHRRPPKPVPVSTPTLAPTAEPTTPPSINPSPLSVPLPGSTPPNPANSPAASGFVTRHGTQLYRQGVPYRFAGLNIYNANSRANCSYTMGTGSTLDSSLTALGGANAFRAWFFQSLAVTGGGRDWSAFDHTLAVARAHNMKVIATLGNQWGDCESPAMPRQKAITWYQSGYRAGIEYPSDIQTYRDYVRDFVARYAGDPTILAYQFINEAEAKNADGSCTEASASAALAAFAADMGQLTKAIDPNHLTSLGTMGNGQCGGSGADYQAIHSSPYIDLCEDHDYHTAAAPMPGDQWNGLQVRIAQCQALNKPLFVGETGIKGAEAGGSLATRASDYAAKVRAWVAAGVAGELAWDWRDAAHGGSSATDYEIGPGDPALSVFTGG